MRTYLTTLHKRSDTHKKNFALLVSGGFTLSIFAVWLFVNYGSLGSPQAVANASSAVQEVGPFQSLGASLAASWNTLANDVKGISNLVRGTGLEQGYNNMKTETFNTYGR